MSTYGVGCSKHDEGRTVCDLTHVNSLLPAWCDSVHPKPPECVVTEPDWCNKVNSCGVKRLISTYAYPSC